MIDSVTKTPALTEAQAKYLNYIVEYQNGEPITTKQLVAKNSFVRLKVRVEYKTDIDAEDLPDTADTVVFKFSGDFKQKDDNKMFEKENLAENLISVKNRIQYLFDYILTHLICHYNSLIDKLSV